MQVYGLNDKISIKIDDITIIVSPLSYKQKGEIQSLISRYSETKDSMDLIEGSFKTLKYAIKEIKGAKSGDNDFSIVLENGIASDDSIEALLNSSISGKLTTASLALLNGIPKEIINPITGKALEGVVVEGFLKQEKVS
jgi:hypothetical protein